MFNFYKLFISIAFLTVSIRIECAAAGIFRNSFQENCGVNQTYLECGSPCSTYCNRHSDDLGVCDAQCYPGCYCKEGFVRLAIDSTQCIAEADCDYIQKCDHAQVYKECNQECQISCDNLTDEGCDLKCFKGCVCKAGFVRKYNSVESECILPSKCPVLNSSFGHFNV